MKSLSILIVLGSLCLVGCGNKDADDGTAIPGAHAGTRQSVSQTASPGAGGSKSGTPAGPDKKGPGPVPGSDAGKKGDTTK